MAATYTQELFGVKTPLDVRRYGKNGIQGMFNPDKYELLPKTLVSIIKSKQATIEDPDNNILILSNYLKRLRNTRQKSADIPDPAVQVKQAGQMPPNAWYDPNSQKITIQDNAGHPSIIAHQLGHSAQKDFKSRIAANLVGALATPILAWTPRLLHKLRYKDTFGFDATDAFILGGASLIGGLANWIAWTKIVNHEREASKKALQYIKDPGTFSRRSVTQSQKALKGALATYKKGRIFSTITGIAAPLLVSGIAIALRGSRY